MFFLKHSVYWTIFLRIFIHQANIETRSSILYKSNRNNSLFQLLTIESTIDSLIELIQYLPRSRQAPKFPEISRFYRQLNTLYITSVMKVIKEKYTRKRLIHHDGATAVCSDSGGFISEKLNQCRHTLALNRLVFTL